LISFLHLLLPRFGSQRCVMAWGSRIRCFFESSQTSTMLVGGYCAAVLYIVMSARCPSSAKSVQF
jgi:hypothetical protein